MGVAELIKLWADLEALLSQKAVEGEQLDFKKEPPANEKIASTICAFANTSGGSIIFGAEYDDRRTRQLIGYPGTVLLDRFAERLEQIALNIRPRVSIEVAGPIQVPTTDAAPRYVYVANVLVGQLQPHMSSYDGRYYVRSGSQNAILPENIIEQMYTARHVARANVERILAEHFHGIPLRGPGGGYWLSLAIVPLHSREDLLPSSDALREMLDVSGRYPAAVYYLDTHFGYEVRVPQTDVGEMPPNEYSYLTRIFHNGLCVDATFMSDQSGIRDRVWEDHYRDCVRLTLALAYKLYVFAKYSGFCRIIVKLYPVVGRVLDRHRAVPSGSIRIGQNELILTLECPASELRSDPVIDELTSKLRRTFGIKDYSGTRS